MCEGCRANARAKRHMTGSFHKDDEKYEKCATLDHVTIADLGHNEGIGNFKYGIVIAHPKSDFWRFIPTRTMKASESNKAFKQFIRTIGLT